jgi:hypothetical protein
MSVSRNPKFPVLDLSGFPIHLTARKDEMLDIGCYEGLVSDGRPFYVRLMVGEWNKLSLALLQRGRPLRCRCRQHSRGRSFADVGKTKTRAGGEDEGGWRRHVWLATTAAAFSIE